MGPYHLLIGSLMDPEDDFCQRLRKSAIAICFIPGSVITFGYTMSQVIGVGIHPGQAPILGLCGTIIATIFFWGMYAYLRYTKEVTDVQAALLPWVAQIANLTLLLNLPEFDQKSVVSGLALLAVLLQIPKIEIFLIFSGLLAILQDWNITHFCDAPNSMLILPSGYHNGGPSPFRGPPMNRFIFGVITVLMLAAIVYNFLRQIRELERRGAAARAANEMTLEILTCQKRYNTGMITRILAECSEKNVVNPKLIALYKSMNDNLESYKPFLPNYLFFQGGGGNGDEDDDAMSIISDASVCPFTMDDTSDISLGASSDGSDSFRGRDRDVGSEERSPRSRNSLSNPQQPQKCRSSLQSAGSSLDEQPQQRPRSSSNNNSNSKNQSQAHTRRGDSPTMSSNAVPRTRSPTATSRPKKVGIQAPTAGGAKSSSLSRVADSDSNGDGSGQSGPNPMAATNVTIPRSLNENTAPVTNSYVGNIAQAWVELQSNPWFSTKLVLKPFDRTLRYQRNTMSVFTEALFDLAQASKASVHNLVGDTVHLSWNATHRVGQPELKAATFLLRLRSALHTALPDVKMAAAACAGPAEVHSTTSLGTRQRAMFLDAFWLPALQACYMLAKRYKTLVVDANIESGSRFSAAAQGIDCIRYVPQVALVPGTGEPGVGALDPGSHQHPTLRPKGFPAALPDFFDTLLGVQGPQQEESAQTFLERKPVQFTVAYELVRSKLNVQQQEEEWMYMVEDQEHGERVDVESLVTRALLMVAEDNVGEAAIFLAKNKIIDGSATGGAAPEGGDAGGGRADAYATDLLGPEAFGDDSEENPDFIPTNEAKCQHYDPLTQALALAAAERDPGLAERNRQLRLEEKEKAQQQPNARMNKDNLLLQRLARYCHSKTQATQ